jgi:hypothetical protein
MPSSEERGVSSAVPSHRLREVTPADPEAIARAARLHYQLFREIGPIAQLGERLLRRFCYTVLIRDGLMKATVLEVEGRPAGLIAYTSDSRAFHAAAFERYLGLVMRETLFSVLLDPSILAGFPRAMRLLRDRREERIEAGGRVAELVALGVLPHFLSQAPELPDLRPADLLLGRAFSDFREGGFRHARGVVLAENRPALMYFRRRASRIERFPNADRPSYQVWFDLEKPRLPEGSYQGR